jgi:hypothetical protein
METFDKICYGLKEIDERIVTCTDTARRLMDRCLRSWKASAEEGDMRTERRTSTATNMAFIGLNGTYEVA